MARQTHVVFDGERVLGGVNSRFAERFRRSGHYVATTEHVRADSARNPMFEVRAPTWRSRWAAGHPRDGLLGGRPQLPHPRRRTARPPHRLTTHHPRGPRP